VYQASIVLLALGAVALFARFAHGHRDAAYGSYVVWGLWVAMYLFFAGVAAGAFCIATLDLLFGLDTFKGTGRVALWIALVSLGGALISIGLDLGHMDRIWKVYLQPNFGSVMAQMVWGYTLFGVLLAAALHQAIKNPGGKALRTVLIVGLPLALFVAGAVGALFGVAASRPAWREGLLPVQFPVLAAASGAAALLAAIGLFGPADDPRRARQIRILSVATAVLVLAKLYFVWTDYSLALYGKVPVSASAVKAILFGPNAWAFWILQIAVGTAIPVVVLLGSKKVSPAVAGVMGVLALVGFAVARANVVIPALAVPELDALATAFSGSPRLQFTYFPSLMEWGVSLGITGLLTLAFLVGSDRLPLRPVEAAPLPFRAKEVA
jgi:molybdopterin-containing oxidoreductase family membrane subunit